MSLAAVIRERAADVLASARDGGHPLVEAQRFIAEFPDEIEDERDRLILQRVAGLFRDAFKAATSASDQKIPGFEDMPGAFTVPDGEGGFRYVAAQFATVGHCRADNAIKHSNVEAVTLEAAKSDRLLDRLLSAPGVTDDTPVLDAANRVSA